jgi:hypothetical protein
MILPKPQPGSSGFPVGRNNLAPVVFDRLVARFFAPQPSAPTWPRADSFGAGLF